MNKKQIMITKHIYKFLIITLIITSCNNVIDSPLEEYVYNTQDEYSYEIIDSIIEDDWTGYHIKMILICFP